ncbi:MAG: cell division protein FtsL [Defluviitaleaceae bacterium]|nr:cell division protein FtsL [Defluviitaleaceae bacterium]
MAKRGYTDYYSHTSEAFSRPSRVERAAAPRQKRIKKVRKPKLQYRDVGPTSRAFSPLSIVTLVLLFAAALGIVMSFALIFERQTAIRSLTAELRQIEEDNNLIRAQISRSYDIREIERIATQRLMMGRPQPHQIVHIYVPVTSHTVPNMEAVTEEPSGGFLDTLLNR